MEVIIDGIKYVPQDCNKVIIGGIKYDNVAHWLTNIHAELLQKWVDKVKAGVPAPALDDVQEFESFVEKYLGFSTPKDGHGFVEKEK